MPRADEPDQGAGRLRRLARRIPRLPEETPSPPVTYTPALVAYVGLLTTVALAAAVMTVRLPADAGLLAMGACATFLLAATAVRVLSGVASFW